MLNETFSVIFKHRAVCICFDCYNKAIVSSFLSLFWTALFCSCFSGKKMHPWATQKITQSNYNFCISSWKKSIWSRTFNNLLMREHFIQWLILATTDAIQLLIKRNEKIYLAAKFLFFWKSFVMRRRARLVNKWGKKGLGSKLLSLLILQARKQVP